MIGETLLRNTASIAVYRVVSQLATILTFAVLFRIESKEVFGQILVFQAILLNLSILDFGLGNTLEKYVSKYLGANNHGQYARAINTNIVVYAGIALVGFCLFAIAGSLGGIAWIGLGITSTLTWFVLGGVACAVWLTQCFQAPLRGLGLFPELNSTQIVVAVSGNALLIVAAVLSDSLAVMLVARYLPGVWGLWRQYQIVMKQAPFRFSWPKFRDHESDGFWQFSGWNFLTRLASQIINEFDKVLVSIFLGANLVPVYYGVMRVLRLPVDVNQVLKSAVIPVASSVQESGDDKKYRRLVEDGTTQANAIYAFFAMLVILYAFELLFILGGTELTNYTLVLQIACLFSMPVAARAFLSQTLMGTGEVIARQALWSVLSGSSFVALLWAGLTHYGVEGGIYARLVNEQVLIIVWFAMVLGFSRVSLGSFAISLFKGQWPFWIGIAGYFAGDSLIDTYLASFTYRVAMMVFAAGIAWQFVLDARIKQFALEKLRLR